MKNHSFEELLKKVGQRCAAKSQPGEAIYDVASILRCGLGLTRVTCAFPCTVMNITTPGCNELPPQASDKLLVLLRLKKRPIVIDGEKNETEQEILKKYGIGVLWPLFSQIGKSQVIGFLALGQKQSKTTVSR